MAFRSDPQILDRMITFGTNWTKSMDLGSRDMRFETSEVSETADLTHIGTIPGPEISSILEETGSRYGLFRVLFRGVRVLILKDYLLYTFARARSRD